MKTIVRWFLILIFTLPASAETMRPAALQGVGIDQRLDEQVPLDLTFRDESGKVVKLAEFFGKKPVVLALVYYECPMLCTLTQNGLVRVMRGMTFNVGEQYTVLSISINPRENPALASAKKAEYLAHYARPGGAAGWHFLTGDDQNIQRLAQAVGFHYKFDPQSGQYAHAAGLVILTPQGRIARYFYGVEFSPRDLRLSLVEASANKIGSTVDEVLLFCFHYDPATGKYGLLVTHILQLAGACTLAVLGIGIGVMLRRERNSLMKA